MIIYQDANFHLATLLFNIKILCNKFLFFRNLMMKNWIQDNYILQYFEATLKFKG